MCSPAQVRLLMQLLTRRRRSSSAGAPGRNRGKWQGHRHRQHDTRIRTSHTGTREKAKGKAGKLSRRRECQEKFPSIDNRPHPLSETAWEHDRQSEIRIVGLGFHIRLVLEDERERSRHICAQGEGRHGKEGPWQPRGCEDAPP